METPVAQPPVPVRIPSLASSELRPAGYGGSPGQPVSPFAPGPIGAGSLWETTHAVSVWQRLTVAFLAIITLVCLHYIAYSMHAILVPFFLSGFIVFALQPSVEVLYGKLAGLAPPYRWFFCCCKRQRSREARAQEKERLYGTCAFVPGDGTGRNRDRSESAAASFPPQVDEADEEEPLLEQVPTFAAQAGEAVFRFLAVLVALASLCFIASMFIILLGHGAMHMQDHWSAYRTGLRRMQKLQDDLIDSTSRHLRVEESVDNHVKQVYDRLLDEAQEYIWLVMNHLLAGLSEGITQLLVVLLYVLFWLMQPLPTGGKVSAVVRSYLWKKSFVSFLYGACVSVLFWSLTIDLAIFFGVVSFFLNFVPEVGAFISMLVPVPIILLDGRLENPWLVLTAATFGQLFFKFLIGNILEVKLIERDKEMSIHPVWIILGLSYFGYVWGPSGALLSVPLLAIGKTAALYVRGDLIDTETVIPALAETFLACLEGRNTCWARPLKEGCGTPSSPGMSTHASPFRSFMAGALGFSAGGVQSSSVGSPSPRTSPAKRGSPEKPSAV